MNQILDKKWLIAQIKPNSYDLAIRNLERQGYEIFVPKMKTILKKENRFINKNIFVFLGYIFIGFNPLNFDWAKMSSMAF